MALLKETGRQVLFCNSHRTMLRYLLQNSLNLSVTFLSTDLPKLCSFSPYTAAWLPCIAYLEGTMLFLP